MLEDLASTVSVLTVCVVADPPLSVEGVVKAMESLTQQWRDVSERLWIPKAVRNRIASECSTDEECLRRAIRYWLLRDPYASWRRIIYRFDYEDDTAFSTVADSLRSNAEPLQGQTQSRIYVRIVGLGGLD